MTSFIDPKTGQRKNILIIISDEHRRDAMGCMGHPIVKTPHLDALAASGTLFTRAYTASPMCVPTRAALASGQYPHQNGFWDSVHAFDGRQSWMHLARAQGYDVTSIGKLHFKSGDNDNGFTQEILPMHIVDGIGWPIGLLRENPPFYDSAAELADEVGRGSSHYTEYDKAITAAAETWIKDPERKTNPFVGFVSLVSPHYPLIAPDEFYDLYDPDEMPLPAPPIPLHPELEQMNNFLGYEEYFDDQRKREAIAAYYGLVSFLDHCIGRILTALEEANLKDDTIIIYVSDHGEMLGDQGFWTKMVMHEASAGIPLIIAGSDIPKGKVTASGAHLLDIATTVVEGTGLEKPQDWPGANLVTLAHAEVDKSRPLFTEYHDGGSSTGTFMLAWDDWKMIYYVGMRPQLFNLAKDPHELDDLGNNPDYAEILAQGEAHLRSICNPEEVSAAAFADQQKMIALLGGEDAIRNMETFGATPTPTLEVSAIKDALTLSFRA